MVELYCHEQNKTRPKHGHEKEKERTWESKEFWRTCPWQRKSWRYDINLLYAIISHCQERGAIPHQKSSEDAQVLLQEEQEKAKSSETFVGDKENAGKAKKKAAGKTKEKAADKAIVSSRSEADQPTQPKVQLWAF